MTAEAEKDVGFLGTGIIDCCELPCGSWNLTWVPWRAVSALSIEPSLQTLLTYVYAYFFILVVVLVLSKYSTMKLHSQITFLVPIETQILKGPITEGKHGDSLKDLAFSQILQESGLQLCWAPFQV